MEQLVVYIGYRMVIGFRDDVVPNTKMYALVKFHKHGPVFVCTICIMQVHICRILSPSVCCAWLTSGSVSGRNLRHFSAVVSTGFWLGDTSVGTKFDCSLQACA